MYGNVRKELIIVINYDLCLVIVVNVTCQSINYEMLMFQWLCCSYYYRGMVTNNGIYGLYNLKTIENELITF